LTGIAGKKMSPQKLNCCRKHPAADARGVISFVAKAFKLVALRSTAQIWCIGNYEKKGSLDDGGQTAWAGTFPAQCSKKSN
jgi:hypothetical protein